MRKLLTALLALTLGATLGACGDDDEEEGAGGGTTEQPTVVNLTGSEYSFQGAPQEVRGGLVQINFRNSGKEFHEAQLLALPSGTTGAQAGAALEAVFGPEGGPIPDFIDPRGGVGEMNPGVSGTTKVNLAPGRYAFICLVQQGSTPEEEGPGTEEGGGGEEGGAEGEEEGPVKVHATLGMVSEFNVTPGTEGDLGAAATIKASEYTFDIPALSAGRQTLELRNDGPAQAHHGVLFEFPAGTTPDQATAAFRAFGEAEASGQPPPEGTPEPRDVGVSAVFNPRYSGTFDVDLKSGTTYAFACFITDRSGGPPHAIGQGMFKPFTVA